MPMRAHLEDGAEFRWLHKTVLDSRVLDSMENLSSWSFGGVGEMTLTYGSSQRRKVCSADPFNHECGPSWRR